MHELHDCEIIVIPPPLLPLSDVQCPFLGQPCGVTEVEDHRQRVPEDHGLDERRVAGPRSLLGERKDHEMIGTGVFYMVDTKS